MRKKKTLNKLERERIFLNIMKYIHEKPAKNILNSKRMEAFPIKINNMKCLPAFTTRSQLGTGWSSYGNKKEKEIICIQNGKEEAKLSLFHDDIIFYVANPNHQTKICWN